MSKFLKIFLPVFLLADIIYSFGQHYYTALDGDMAAIILPAAWYQEVLNDPFGINILIGGNSYGGAGRFFCHWFMSIYYEYIPLFLQNFIDPIESVYFATALIKTFIQVSLIGILTAYVSGTIDFRKKDFLITAAIITPFFQTHGYSLYMGVIEKAPTYTFFYPLPLAVLLLFFLPMFFYSVFNKKIISYYFFLPLVVVLPFSGPLIPAIVLLVCPVFLIFNFNLIEKLGLDGMSFLNKVKYSFSKIPRSALIMIGLLILLSAYSFYLSKYNIEAMVSENNILEQYKALAFGVYKQFTQKLGIPLLFSCLMVNYFLVKNISSKGSDKLLSILKCISLFSIAYILLLPLGGCRNYRSLIIRHDSMMPVTLCMIYMFAASSFFLLKNLNSKFKLKFSAVLVLVLLIYTIADEPKYNHNLCEKNALKEIARSEEKIILLDQDCPIISWNKITDKNNSWWNAQLLKKWKIIEKDKLYYQK